MKILSLFDGISCGRVALERVGIPVEKYYASEIDKYAIQITQKNYPDTIQLGDVTKIDFTQFIGEIDMIIGGSPCQDLSIAKHDRKGLNGDRSGLFYKYLEALKTIKPKYFLLENVASMSKETKETITNELKEVYPETECTMINSALVSAQQRKRYYWTNWKIEQPEDKGIFVKDILESGLSHLEKTRCVDASYYNGVSLEFSLRKSKRDLVFGPVRIGNLTGLGKGQANRIYSVEGKSACLNANGGGGGAKTGLYKVDLPDGNYTVRTLTPLECERLQTLPPYYTADVVSNTQRYKAIGNGWTVDVIAHIFREMLK